MILTVISIIESLLVIIPALLTVAFVTISERKTMASMQRRLGPNIVGWENKYLCQTKRLFYSSSNSNINIINTLYENRLVPVKLFESQVIDTCYNLTSIEQRIEFFNKFKNKGGIYLIQYKDDLSIYYIGRAKKID